MHIDACEHRIIAVRLKGTCLGIRNNLRAFVDENVYAWCRRALQVISMLIATFQCLRSQRTENFLRQCHVFIHLFFRFLSVVNHARFFSYFFLSCYLGYGGKWIRLWALTPSPPGTVSFDFPKLFWYLLLWPLLYSGQGLCQLWMRHLLVCKKSLILTQKWKKLQNFEKQILVWIFDVWCDTTFQAKMHHLFDFQGRKSHWFEVEMKK